MEERYVNLLSDTTIKYLWKNEITKKWFNEIIFDKVGVDLSDFILVDAEYNTGSKVKDYRTDLTFSDKKNSIIVEMNREYSISIEIKGRSYLFRRSGSIFNSGENYTDDRTSTLIMINNYKKSNFSLCSMATYEMFSKELNDSYSDIKICEIYLPVFNEKSYNSLSTIDKRLWLFTCTSYEEMYEVVDDEESLYIIQELERLSMNDKFMGEYDTKLVNKTLMASMKDEGYTNGLNEGKQLEKIEIAKKSIEKEY